MEWCIKLNVVLYAIILVQSAGLKKLNGEAQQFGGNTVVHGPGSHTVLISEISRRQTLR